MKKLNNLNDEILKTLLKNYKDEKLSSNHVYKINQLVKQGFEDKQLQKNSFFSFVLSPIPALSIAGVILILFFIINIIPGFNNLNQSIILSEYNTNSKEKKIINKNITLDTFKKNPIKMQTEDSIFLIKENTKFVIKKNESEAFSNNYYLETGSIYINADRLNKMRTLKINTSLGSIKVVGTKFEIDDTAESLIIKCFEGKVEFITKINGLNNCTIDDGFSLIININIKEQELFEIPKEEIIIPVLNRDILNKPEKNNETKVDDLKKSNQEEPQDKMMQENWRIILPQEEYKKIIILQDYLAMISAQRILILDKTDGKVISELDINENQEGFTSYKNNLIFYEAPDKIKMSNVVNQKQKSEFMIGTIAFGGPVVCNNYLISVSTDRNIYIYDLMEKKLINKFSFDSGLYGTPVVIDDYVFTISLAKKLIAYSISKNKIIWEYKNNDRFLPDKPVINENNSLISLIDENNNVNVFDAKKGYLIFKMPIDKKVSPVFINDDLIVFNNGYLVKINSIGEKTIIKGKEESFGILKKSDKIYLIEKNNVLVYDLNFNKLAQINLNHINIYNYFYNELFILQEDNKLIKFKTGHKNPVRGCPISRHCEPKGRGNLLKPYITLVY